MKKRNKKKIIEDFSRFETAQETMNAGNLIAAQKLTTMNKGQSNRCLCSQT